MGWTVKFTPQAEKEMEKLDPGALQAIRDYLRHRVLACDHPRQFGKPLGYDKSGFWRYRVGKYRIICDIRQEVCIVLVVQVGKRDKIYG